jgi:hypothetical protein
MTGAATIRLALSAVGVCLNVRLSLTAPGGEHGRTPSLGRLHNERTKYA